MSRYLPRPGFRAGLQALILNCTGVRRGWGVPWLVPKKLYKPRFEPYALVQSCIVGFLGRNVRSADLLCDIRFVGQKVVKGAGEKPY